MNERLRISSWRPKPVSACAWFLSTYELIVLKEKLGTYLNLAFVLALAIVTAMRRFFSSQLFAANAAFASFSFSNSTNAKPLQVLSFESKATRTSLRVPYCSSRSAHAM